MNFDAFSPLNGGSIGTYGYASESPMDLDAGLDFTRPRNSIDMFPFPVVLGWVDGFVPLAGELQSQIAYGKTAFGPWQGANNAVAETVFPNLMGSLAKVSG
jgi:hypothetical protein